MKKLKYSECGSIVRNIYWMCFRMTLGRIFGMNRDEVRRGLRKLHNEKVHKLYSFPRIIRMVKSTRAGNVELTGEKGNA
jgi:hypothetical protein